SIYLAFSVGEDESHLFVLRASGVAGTPQLQAYRIPLSEKQLGQRVAALRYQLTGALPGRGIQLVPTGGEVPARTPEALHEASLGLERPLVYTASLAVFAQACEQRAKLAAGARPTLLAVGNPLFTREAAAGGEPSTADRGREAAEAPRPPAVTSSPGHPVTVS